MLKSIRLQNFLSHEDTKIEFSESVNIFVGKNGAGKSSVIDAITYALYNKHSRDVNRNIVRKGSNGGSVMLTFLSNGKEYEVYRKFKHDGSLDNASIRDEKNLLAAGGKPRKGVTEEGVESKVRSILGLDYDDIVIATIIKQGELDTIVDLQPKEVKELINRLIGLDRLDKAYIEFRDVIDKFRSRVRSEVGYDITDLERLKKELKNLEKELDDAIKRKEDAAKDLLLLEEELEYQERLLEGYKHEKKDRIEYLKSIYEKYHDSIDELYRYLKNEYNRRYKEILEKIKKGLKYLCATKYSEEIQRSYDKVLELEKDIIILEGLLHNKKKLEKQIAEIKAEVKKYKSIKCEKEIEIIQLICEIDAKQYKSIDDVKDIIDNLDNLKKNIMEEIENISKTIGMIKKILEDYYDMMKNGKCPTCEREISDIDLTSKIKEKEKVLENLNEILEELKRKGKKLEELSNKCREYKKILEKLNELNQKLTELEKEYNDILKKYNKLVNKSRLGNYIIEEEKLLKKIKEIIEIEKIELGKMVVEIQKAKGWLSASKISSMNDIVMLKKELEYLKSMCLKLNNIEEIKLEDLAIDDYTKELINNIKSLEEKAITLAANIKSLEKEDMAYREEDRITLAQIRDIELEIASKIRATTLAQIIAIEEEITSKIRDIEGQIESKIRDIENKIKDINRKIGILESTIEELERKIEELERKIEELERKIEELRRASEYLKLYEKIREDIYHTRLPMKLRGWVFDEISNKASEYLRVFEIGISHIMLKEENNGVSMRCYGSSEMDIHSMSGGEKVAISLALRFAIASLRGRGSTDFIILDEPTMHLDQERRRALIKLISRIGGYQGLLRQIIMITHDDEIIEDTEIDNIIKFEKRGGISRVSIER